MILLDECTKILRTPKRKTVVLDEVNFLIPQTGVTVILGQQGSGKSTLIRILAGSERPSMGSVSRSCSVSPPLGTMGYYHQRAKARHVVYHMAEVYGINARSIIHFLERLPGIFEMLDEEMRDLPAQLRITLAYAIGYALPFDMYLMDTSFAVGSPQFRAFCGQFLAERRRTSGIVIATSSHNIARTLADRIVILDRGKLTEVQDKSDALARFKQLSSIRQNVDQSS